MRGRVFRIVLLLFGSGFTALIYQVAWLRGLRLVFGSSTAASSAVVAIFMGGLGLGSWLLGRRVDQTSRPLTFYGRLELAIAGSAAVTPALLWLVRSAYIASGGSARLGMIGGTAVRLLFSALVLAVPTILMGGTLPAATRAVETNEDRGRRLLALLYGANALGAVAGTLLSTFYLLETLGTRATLWASCVVNVLIGLAAVAWAGPPLPAAEYPEAPVTSVPPHGMAVASAHPDRDERTRRREKKGKRRVRPEEGAEATPRRVSSTPRRFILVAAALTGFSFTLMELVWYRMLAPLLGGSTYTFGLILAIALAGIGLGSLTRYGRERPGTFFVFAVTCALEAALLALPYAMGDAVAILAALLRPIGAFGFGGFAAGWTLVATLVVFPASFLAGIQFPILISLLGEGRERVGTDVGAAYAWNTVGALVGSLTGGFGLLPLLSAPRTWAFVTILLAALAVASLYVAATRRERLRLRWPIPLAAAATGVLFLSAGGPTAAWRHSPIGAGRVDLSNASPNRLREWVRDYRRRLVWEAEGVESSVALVTTSGGLAFAVNGKIDGNSRTDAPTQVMGGLIGSALHPNPRTALVIGLGTGTTAGWLAAVRSIERVDVVELEPAILHVADACAPVNQNVLANPKVHVTIGDAREYLLTSRESYDVIFSEPSNPYRAGVSSLFTAEFYEAVRRRLAPGGIFLQWLQTYEVDGETVRTVYATLAQVFPEVESWFSRVQDLVLAATVAPMTYDATSLRARLSEEPYRAALVDAWGVAGLEGFLSHYIARSSFVAGLLAGERAQLNTDDRNVVEFAFARSLGRDTVFDLEKSRALARERKEDAPSLTRGAVDWRLVQRLRVSTITADGVIVRTTPDLADEERRQSQVQRSFLEGRPDLVLARWRAAPWEPVGLVELVVVAQSLADAGDEGAVAYIERLGETRPVEAGVLLAALRSRQGRSAESADAIEKALARYREDPWPLLSVTNKSFQIVADLAGRDRSLAARMDAVLTQPFAVSLLNEERLQTRYKVATYLDQSKLEEAIAALEPNVPWKRALLARRAKLYEAVGNPRAVIARRELELFLKHDTGGAAFTLESPAQSVSPGKRE